MKVLSFEQEWTRQNYDRIQILRFMREAIGVDEVQWQDLTTLNLSKVREFITEKVAGNSAVTYLAIIKAFLSRYADEGIVPCKTEGNPINVAFNAAYIMDIMKNIETDEAEINLNNSLSPVCIKPTSDEEYIYIVTPVRVIF